MEFIPLAKDPLLAPMRIPYLPSNPAHDEKLLNHPVFSIPTLSEKVYDLPFLDGFRPLAIFAMIQSIWFFRFIDEVFTDVWHVTFKKGDFIREEGSQIFVKTDLLLSHAERFSQKFEKYSEAHRARSIDRAHQIVIALRRGMAMITGNIGFKIALREFPSGEEVICSIYIIAETLASITAKVGQISYGYVVGGNFTFYADDELHQKWPEQNYLRQRLDRGWSPSEVEYIVKSFSLRSQYYISNLRRCGQMKSLESRPTSAPHSQSSSRHPQKPKHRHENCSCVLVSTSDAQVEMTLHQGRIPRLHLAPKLPWKSTENQCEVKDSGMYVAISHVWSQGLGNAQANMLPQCQLLFLQNLVQSLYPPNHFPVHLWVDTLCVPAEPEGKKLGLRLLKKAFDGADRVLVVDADLLDVGNVSQEELLLRINCSVWMRRLWTLSEAIVSSRKLYVQLLHRAIAFETLLGDRCPDRVLAEEQGPCVGFHDDISGNFGKIWRISREQNLGRRFVKLLPVLHRRQTTEQSDETICIASMLDIPVDPFLDSPSEQRMRKLIPFLHKIPSSVIFTDAPRLEEFGFRWAPKTFLTGEIDFMTTVRSDQFLATWTGAGIAVQLSGVKLQVFAQNFMTHHSPGFFYILHKDRWTYANLILAGTRSAEVLGPREFSAFALLTYPTTLQRRAVLVVIHDDSEDCLKASILGRYNIGDLRNSFEKCASGTKRQFKEQGVQFEVNTSEMEAEERAKFQQIDTTHQGLFSLGVSAVATEVFAPSQWWQID